MQGSRAAFEETIVGKAGKSRNAATKRFKVTGSGKITRRRGRFAHLLTKKTSSRKRVLGSNEQIDAADLQNVRRMING
jgi:large subunit ribosomal protein L35